MMDVEKMVESVARALCNANGGYCDSELMEMHGHAAKAAIRAVLDEIRYPDSAMIDAGNAALGLGMVNADNAYIAMIDHLLEKLDDHEDQ